MFQFQKWNSSACSAIISGPARRAFQGFNSRSGIPQLAPPVPVLGSRVHGSPVSIPEVEFLSLLLWGTYSWARPLLARFNSRSGIPQLAPHHETHHSLVALAVLFQFQKWNSSACSRGRLIKLPNLIVRFQFQKWNSSACSNMETWTAQYLMEVSIPEVEFLSLLLFHFYE